MLTLSGWNSCCEGASSRPASLRCLPAVRVGVVNGKLVAARDLAPRLPVGHFRAPRRRRRRTCLARRRPRRARAVAIAENAEVVEICRALERSPCSLAVKTTDEVGHGDLLRKLCCARSGVSGHSREASSEAAFSESVSTVEANDKPSAQLGGALLGLLLGLPFAAATGALCSFENICLSSRQ